MPTPPQPEPLYDEPTIRGRVHELAEQISRDYQGVPELHLVGVLKGAFIFLADLTRCLTIPHRVDFIALASYGDAGAERGGVRLIMDLRTRVSGAHVLLVDDIMDSGSTLRFLKDLIETHRPASVRTCVLTRKSKPREVVLDVDYVGFDIPDVWVVGYGLDYADRHRTLPYIGVLKL